MDSITLQAHEDCTKDGLVFDLHSLYAHSERVADPRKPKGVRYHLATLLVLILMAKLGGQNHPTGIAEWLKHRGAGLVEMLKLPQQRIPPHCTYRWVLQDLESELFEQVVGEYQRSRQPGGSEIVISIDGKSLRGTNVKEQ